MVSKKFLIKVEKLFLIMVGIYLVNALVFNTVLSSKNIDNQRLVREISVLQTENDMMTAKIGQMKSYQTIFEVAQANGWSTNQNNIRTIE